MRWVSRCERDGSVRSAPVLLAVVSVPRDEEGCRHQHQDGQEGHPCPALLRPRVLREEVQSADEGDRQHARPERSVDHLGDGPGVGRLRCTGASVVRHDLSLSIEENGTYGQYLLYTFYGMKSIIGYCIE